MDLVRAHVLVQGLVQGVYFRANTAEKARSNGVAGWVRNNLDGAVEAVFEGKKDAVNKVIEWCRTGPMGAQGAGRAGAGRVAIRAPTPTPPAQRRAILRPSGASLR